MEQNIDTNPQEVVNISSPEHNDERPAAETRSNIWEFFTKNSQGDKCTCNFCGTSYSCGKSKGPKQGEISEIIINVIYLFITGSRIVNVCMSCNLCFQ